MKTYHGRREGPGVLVTVNGHPLDPRLDLWSHSPTGFEWSYGGSGPAQLALALAVDATGDAELALRHHQELKRRLVTGWKHEWKVTAREICEFVAAEERHLIPS